MEQMLSLLSANLLYLLSLRLILTLGGWAQNRQLAWGLLGSGQPPTPHNLYPLDLLAGEWPWRLAALPFAPGYQGRAMLNLLRQKGSPPNQRWCAS
jgi:hypothetical protein